MKYIKFFEALEKNSEYWRIDCKSMPHILVSLEKIGLSKDEQIYQDIINSDSEYFIKYNITHFYIMKGLNKYNEEYWYFSTNLEQFKGKAKYNGRVKVEKWELNAYKYNL